MEININLLPEEKRKRLKLLTDFLVIKNILAWMVIGLALISIVLLWGTTVLIDEFQNLSESTNLINREYSRYNGETKEINKTIHDFNITASNFKPTTPLLLELASKMPADIKLDSLTLDLANKKIEITGIAKNAIDLTLDGREISVDQQGDFDETIALLPGYNIINIKAKDKFGNVDDKNYQLMYKGN